MRENYKYFQRTETHAEGELACSGKIVAPLANCQCLILDPPPYPNLFPLPLQNNSLKLKKNTQTLEQLSRRRFSNVNAEMHHTNTVST